MFDKLNFTIFFNVNYKIQGKLVSQTCIKYFKYFKTILMPISPSNLHINIATFHLKRTFGLALKDIITAGSSITRPMI